MQDNFILIHLQGGDIMHVVGYSHDIYTFTVWSAGYQPYTPKALGKCTELQ